LLSSSSSLPPPPPPLSSLSLAAAAASPCLRLTTPARNELALPGFSSESCGTKQMRCKSGQKVKSNTSVMRFTKEMREKEKIIVFFGGLLPGHC
jgi:hypothetical protein